jgi:hypothetical protein
VSFSEDACTISLDGIATVHMTVDLSLLNSHVHDLRRCSKLPRTISASIAAMYEIDRFGTV